jgi:uncharacterized protein YeaO (DUF488 family)
MRTKRAYDPADRGDGYRVLIDHIWPLGVTREQAPLDEWARDLTPSDELRRWFSHDCARFGEFRTRHRDELNAQRESLAELRRRAMAGPVTIVYAAS